MKSTLMTASLVVGLMGIPLTQISFIYGFIAILVGSMGFSIMINIIVKTDTRQTSKVHYVQVAKAEEKLIRKYYETPATNRESRGRAHV